MEKCAVPRLGAGFRGALLSTSRKYELFLPTFSLLDNFYATNYEISRSAIVLDVAKIFFMWKIKKFQYVESA